MEAAAVPPRPLVPATLASGPFTVADARAAGLARWHLEGASWKRIGPATYQRADLFASPDAVLAATRLRLPPGSAFSGRTAAWLHGLDVEPCRPIEATVPAKSGVSARSGVALRRASLGRGDVVVLRGLPATSLLRTLADISLRQSLVEAVVVADMALHARLLVLRDLERWANDHKGRQGVAPLRRLIGLAEPLAESPMETRLRLLLVLASLPRPQAQVPLSDANGRFLGRADLFYPKARLAIEFDGGHHRHRLVEDNRRQNLLLNAGYALLRFTGADILGQPDLVVAQVGAALSADVRIRRHLRASKPT
jgi:hypothetical protein